jgi:hypothetical protein
VVLPHKQSPVFWVVSLTRNQLPLQSKRRPPNNLQRSRELNSVSRRRMKELDVDVFKLETDDIQNARMAFKGDWTPKFIAVACVLFFGGYIALVTLQDPATTDNGIVNLVLGYLGGIVSSIISFYYGASHKHDE